MVSQNMTVMTVFSVNPTCKNSQIANFSMNSDLDGSECFYGYNFNVIHTNNKKKIQTLSWPTDMFLKVLDLSYGSSKKLKSFQDINKLLYVNFKKCVLMLQDVFLWIE